MDDQDLKQQASSKKKNGSDDGYTSQQYGPRLATAVG
jgi:hypothetical protein